MLTDKQYLEHMIPHHQVAVEMSKNLQRSSNSPTMLGIAWKIIWFQEFEIAWMKGYVNSSVPSITHDEQKGRSFMPGNLIDCYYPKNSQDLCVKPGTMDGIMFEPSMHKNKYVTDKAFLVHMIPHHQIAINMSHKLLKYTRDTRMMELAYKIIGSQQEEIWHMKTMLKNLRLFHSPLLQDHSTFANYNY